MKVLLVTAGGGGRVELIELIRIEQDGLHWGAAVASWSVPLLHGMCSAG